MVGNDHEQPDAEQRPSRDQLLALQALWRASCRVDATEAMRQEAAEHAEKLARECADREGELAEVTSVIAMMLAPVLMGKRLTLEAGALIDEYFATAFELLDDKAAEDTQVEWAATRPLIYVLEPDPTLAADLTQQVEHFGYDVTVAVTFEALLKQVADQAPRAVVMDAHLRGVETASAAEQLHAAAGQSVPLVLLSDRGDVESRLQAVRAGADTYMAKPFDLHDLIDQLDRLAWQRTQEPLQVMIVEDSVTQGTYYSSLLRKAGMVTTVVRDPLRLLDVLHEKAVDLILMDMYMPGCDGQELAKVVRQFPRYASIPIVYLSGETEIKRQLDALSRGGDDFLTKPIDPGHLIRSVAIRAERARTLRTFMLTDALTGLLNHTRIKEQLQSEVARHARCGGKLAFAMLDIDHFKSVNDTYGHSVGDRVIKTLARVLQQRLRATDYVGRYGGEEFAVIMVDANVDEAVEILDQVRASFESIRQFTQDGGFRVTLSGGVAGVPPHSDAATVTHAADQALYAAKHAGRNRILQARDVKAAQRR